MVRRLYAHEFLLNTVRLCNFNAAHIQTAFSPMLHNKLFGITIKWADSHHPAHAQGLIRAFALYRYILQYQMTLAADSEGRDQTAHAVCSGPSMSVHVRKAFSCDAAHL